MTVYQRKNPKGVDTLRVDAHLKGVPVHAMVESYMNPLQTDMLKECETLEKTEDGKTAIMYWRFKMPLMSDRDNVAKICQVPQEDGSIFGYCITIDHEKKPMVKNVVRMWQKVYFRCSVKDDVMTYTEISNFDMKGYMPAKLMNMVLSAETEKEFCTLYKHWQTKYFKK